MPIYAFSCEQCGEAFDRKLSIDGRDTPQTCAECGGVALRVVTGCNFNLPGDGWASKNIRVKGQMAKKNKRLTRTTQEQIREQPLVKLVPNVEGQRVESWSEAKKLAGSQGKNTDTYAPMIAKEAKK